MRDKATRRARLAQNKLDQGPVDMSRTLRGCFTVLAATSWVALGQGAALAQTRLHARESCGKRDGVT
jgi:hypothetical protein